MRDRTRSHLTVQQVTDERATIWLERPGRRRLRVVDLNHDEHGWDGMTVAIRTATVLAKALGVEVHAGGWS